MHFDITALNAKSQDFVEMFKARTRLSYKNNHIDKQQKELQPLQRRKKNPLRNW